jgi:hypothetical protein
LTNNSTPPDNKSRNTKFSTGPTGAEYPFTRLYELSHEGFKLALGMIDDWRLDRHYLSKLTLLDHAELQSLPIVQ